MNNHSGRRAWDCDLPQAMRERAEYFRQKAQAAESIAEAVREPAAKTTWRTMAEAWRHAGLSYMRVAESIGA